MGSHAVENKNVARVIRNSASQQCATEDCAYKNLTPSRARKLPSQSELDWVQCENCDEWFHWICVETQDQELDNVETWYCQDCIDESAVTPGGDPLKITYKNSNLRKSTRSLKNLNYANLHQGLEPDPNRWADVVKSKPLVKDAFKHMKGKDITLAWLYNDPEAMTEPIIFEEKSDLGMRLPDPSTTVQDVADVVGPDTPVEVIDVASQETLKNWNLSTWARYYTDKDRSKIRNVISLEVSFSTIGKALRPPRIVAEMDWVEKHWPVHLRNENEYPKVQKYCLMSVAKCWTDWHVDFAASSVWYHILRGSKTFYFIRPTRENLAAYERWSGSSDRQENTWLGDEVDHVYEVNLTAGNTMIIPTGWIHAVYTPSDSLVFGGNFLHSLNIATQLELHRIEIATKVPSKFRFPMFIKLLWHVSKYYHDQLTKLDLPKTPQPSIKPSLPQHITPRILRGLKALTSFMKIQVGKALHEKESVTPEQRKAARNNIPWDQIPKPEEMIQSLRELVLVALGETEEDQPREQALVTGKREATPNGPPAKRRKLEDVARSSSTTVGPKSTILTQTPVISTKKEDRRTAMLPRPVKEGETEGEPEPCEIVTLTEEKKTVQISRGKEKVAQVTRTNISITEKVIWTVVKQEDVHMEQAPSILTNQLEDPRSTTPDTSFAAAKDDTKGTSLTPSFDMSSAVSADLYSQLQAAVGLAPPAKPALPDNSPLSSLPSSAQASREPSLVPDNDAGARKVQDSHLMPG